MTAIPKAAGGHSGAELDAVPSLAEEWCGGAELQMLIGGGVCTEVDCCVDEAAGDEERDRRHDTARRNLSPVWARPMARRLTHVGAYGWFTA